jgi:hypothetical protein
MSVHVLTPSLLKEVRDEQTTLERRLTATAEHRTAFRLQANMRRGTGSSVPSTRSEYPTLDEARHAAREALRDDRMLRVTVVTNTVPPRFVEWVNR